MKQALDLRVSQSLTLTPQLRQAIRLLQLSTIELQQEIQQLMESNPMLEIPEESASTEEENNAEHYLEHHAEHSQETHEESSEHTDMNFDKNNETENDHEPSWEDESYQQTGSNTQSGNNREQQTFDFAEVSQKSLRDHLLWQLGLTPFSETDKFIAVSIIDSLDDDGFLSCPLEEIQEGLQHNEVQAEMDEIVAVLHRLQGFDPTGVCARNLQECQVLQLRQLPAETPYRHEAITLVKHYLDLLAQKDYNALARKTKLSTEHLKNIISLIQEMRPRPGSSIIHTPSNYVVPDVIVKKNNKGRWIVELNEEILPKIQINQGYANLIQRANHSADNQYLRNHLQEARWILKSIQSRHETLKKVAEYIVGFQQDFLDQGPEAMKPLILSDVALGIGMHESTVSRVTTQKYIFTPQGIFELKYFFSSHVGTQSGGECSSTAIRAFIKKIISEENAKRPMSDNKIATLLAKQGIRVARRTVAKYRESLSIPSSSERKVLV